MHSELTLLDGIPAQAHSAPGRRGRLTTHPPFPFLGLSSKPVALERPRPARRNDEVASCERNEVQRGPDEVQLRAEGESAVDPGTPNTPLGGSFGTSPATGNVRGGRDRAMRQGRPQLEPLDGRTSAEMEQEDQAKVTRSCEMDQDRVGEIRATTSGDAVGGDRTSQLGVDGSATIHLSLLGRQGSGRRVVVDGDIVRGGESEWWHCSRAPRILPILARLGPAPPTLLAIHSIQHNESHMSELSQGAPYYCFSSIGGSRWRRRGLLGNARQCTYVPRSLSLSGD